jgi:hypothetical protein
MPLLSRVMPSSLGSAVARRARSDAVACLILAGIVVGIFALQQRNCTVAGSSGGRPPRMPLDQIRVAGPLPGGVAFGNAVLDGRKHKNWFVGHFVDDINTLQHSEDVEVKFSQHLAGTLKARGSSVNLMSRSMAVLVSGVQRLEFDNTTVLLEKPGDYCIWSAGVSHSWTVLRDATIISIRWPSIAGDQLQVAPNAKAQVENRNDALTGESAATSASPQLRGFIENTAAR